MNIKSKWLWAGVALAIVMSAVALYPSVATYRTLGTSHYTSDISMVDADIYLEGNELYLDADDDTSITADTDDRIDIEISGADDFRFTANTFTALDGSTIAADFLVLTEQTAISVTAQAYITPTGTYQPLTSGAAVSTSLTTAIMSGTVPGQLLVLTNENASDAITIVDGANTQIGGDKVLGATDALFLKWDEADWICIGYNDN